MKFLLFSLTFFHICLSYGQKNNVSWVESLNFNQGFSPNMDRFTSMMDERIEFYAESEGYTYFFSANAIIIGRPYLPTREELKEVHEKKEKGEDVDVEWPWSLFKIELDGALESVKLTPSELNHHKIHFQSPFLQKTNL